MNVPIRGGAAGLHKYSSPKLAEKQDPFTTKVGKGTTHGENSIQKSIDAMQKQIEGFYKIAIASAKNPSLDEKNQGDQATQMVQLMSASTTAQASKITAQAAQLQEANAKMQQSLLTGKSVKVASNRSFTAQLGERVNFKYDLASNIPKNASISGTVTVLDSNKRKIRTEQIRHMNVGKNEFSWDGLNDLGKVAKEGQYSIEVKASYKTPGNNNSTPAIVNTMIEAKIVEVDVQAGEVTLSDGSKVSINDVARYYDESASQKTKKASSPPDTSKAQTFLNKNIVIKEDKVKFEGSKNTKLGFNSTKDVEKARVKVIVRQDRETKSVEIKEMPIKKGRNEFAWSGESTLTDADFEAKKGGKKFGQIGYGEYEYVIYISEDEGPWEAMGSKSEVLVEATQNELGTTMLKLQGGGLVPETAFDGFAKTTETIKPDELAARAAGFVGKKIEVPRIAEYNGTQPYERSFDLMFGEDVEMAISATFLDNNGDELRTINIPAAQVEASLAQQLTYDNLDDASKAKLVTWISLPNKDYWEFTKNGQPVSYANLHPNNKPEVDAHIIEQLKSGSGKPDEGYQLKTGFQPSIKVRWDGRDNTGKQMPAGTYSYKYTYTLTDTDSGETQNIVAAEKMPLRITHAQARDGKVIGTLEDTRKIEITPNAIFVAG